MKLRALLPPHHAGAGAGSARRVAGRDRAGFTAFEPRWTSAVPPTITRPMRSIAHHEHKRASRRLPMLVLRPGSYDAVLFADVDLDSYPLSHEEAAAAMITW